MCGRCRGWPNAGEESRNGCELSWVARQRGGALLLDREERLSAVAIKTGAAFAAGKPKRLLETRYYVSPWRPYDVSRDGHRSLMIKENAAAGDQTSSRDTIVVVANWIEELKSRFGVN